MICFTENGYLTCFRYQICQLYQFFFTHYITAYILKKNHYVPAILQVKVTRFILEDSVVMISPMAQNQ